MKDNGLILSDWQVVKQIRARLRDEGRRLVFTNGIFDLLHVGHLRYLEAAARQGDVLWVGLNSDRSVRMLKREPLIPWAERAELLAALSPVDAVIFFDETTADEILRLVVPDLYVKGGDYSIASLPEAPTAHALGAEVRILPFVKGRSTTQIIQSILERYNSGSRE